MPVPGIDTARENLQRASTNYADIQRQLDRYNKVFEAYSQANPETQMRAASVMRQALDEYNGLKKQQEENALKMFEAQQRVGYYNQNNMQASQTPQTNRQSVSTPISTDIVMPTPTRATQTITTTTGGTLNNTTPVANTQVNAIDTNTTTTIPTSTQNLVTLNNQNKVSPTTPIGVTNILNSQTPQYSNTTIGTVDNKSSTTANIKRPNYGQGSVAQYTTMPGIPSTYSYTSSNGTGKTFTTSRRKLSSLRK